MLQQIKVKWYASDEPYDIRLWLELLTSEEIIACDFEVAPNITKEERKNLLDLYDRTIDNEYKRRIQQKLEVTGLSHPSFTVITHFSFAVSDNEGYVAICKTDEMRNLVLKWITNTKQKQLWHNSCYDLRLVYYYTKKIPYNFVDTQLLAKCILNNADSSKDRTGLKYLMAYAYGEWSISKDNFTLEEQENSKVLEYAATDACATYKLYQDILEDIRKY